MADELVALVAKIICRFLQMKRETTVMTKTGIIDKIITAIIVSSVLRLFEFSVLVDYDPKNCEDQSSYSCPQVGLLRKFSLKQRQPSIGRSDL